MIKLKKYLVSLLIAGHIIAPLRAMQNDKERALALVAHTIQKNILSNNPIDTAPVIKTLADNKFSPHHLLHVEFTYDDLQKQRLHDWKLTANTPSITPTAYWQNAFFGNGWYNLPALMAQNGNMKEIVQIFDDYETRNLLYKPAESEARFDVFEDAVIAHYKKTTEKDEYVSLYDHHKVIGILAKLTSTSRHDYQQELDKYQDADYAFRHNTEWKFSRDLLREATGSAVIVGLTMGAFGLGLILSGNRTEGSDLAKMGPLFSVGVGGVFALSAESITALHPKPQRPSEPLASGMSTAKKALILKYAVHNALRQTIPSLAVSTVQDAITAIGFTPVGEIESLLCDGVRLYFDRTTKKLTAIGSPDKFLSIKD